MVGHCLAPIHRIPASEPTGDYSPMVSISRQLPPSCKAKLPIPSHPPHDYYDDYYHYDDYIYYVDDYDVYYGCVYNDCDY